MCCLIASQIRNRQAYKYELVGRFVNGRCLHKDRFKLVLQVWRLIAFELEWFSYGPSYVLAITSPRPFFSLNILSMRSSSLMLYASSGDSGIFGRVERLNDHWYVRISLPVHWIKFHKSYPRPNYPQEIQLVNLLLPEFGLVIREFFIL